MRLSLGQITGKKMMIELSYNDKVIITHYPINGEYQCRLTNIDCHQNSISQEKCWYTDLLIIVAEQLLYKSQFKKRLI